MQTPLVAMLGYKTYYTLTNGCIKRRLYYRPKTNSNKSIYQYGFEYFFVFLDDFTLPADCSPASFVASVLEAGLQQQRKPSSLPVKNVSDDWSKAEALTKVFRTDLSEKSANGFSFCFFEAMTLRQGLAAHEDPPTTKS